LPTLTSAHEQAFADFAPPTWFVVFLRRVGADHRNAHQETFESLIRHPIRPVPVLRLVSRDLDRELAKIP
jgi:hypothetical protein